MRVHELKAQYLAVPGTTEGHRKLSTPLEAAALFVPWLAGEAQEVFMIACLDTKNHLIAVSEIGRGSIDTVGVHPREVFKLALLSNAASIVTAHNHPSGDVTPSVDDVLCFQRLTSAGDLLGVEVLDHLIVGDGKYWSQQQRWKI